MTMRGRMGMRVRQGLLTLGSLLLLPVDGLRLTGLFLRLTLRFASRTYTWFLSGLSHTHRPNMEVYLCRPRPDSGRWDDKPCFIVRRNWTLRVLAWLTGRKVPRFEQLRISKDIANVLRLGRWNFLRMGAVLSVVWALFAGGGTILWRMATARGGEREQSITYQRKADRFRDEGKPRQARIQYLNSLQCYAGNASAQWGLAQCALDLNHVAEARRTLERLLKMEPNHTMGRAALIDLLRREGRTREALRLAQEGGRLHPDDPGFRVRIGECQRQLGRVQSALHNARSAVELAPDHARALLLAAAAAADLGQSELAQDYLDGISVLVPQERWDLLGMARVLIQCGRGTEARNLLTPLLAQESTRVPAARELAELRLATGDADGAIDIYQSLAPSEAGDSAIRVRLAVLLLAERRLDEAYETGKALIRDSPQSASGPLVLGTVYYLRELWSACVEQCQASLQRDPKSIAGRTLLSRVLMRQGRYTEAIPWLKGLVDGDWLNLETLLMLAECHLELNQNQEALTLLERARILYPASESPHLLTARLHLALNRPDWAIDSYRCALKINPKHALALNNLASLIVSREAWTASELEEAYQLAVAAWNLHPGNPEIADTLGWVEVLRGNHGHAHPLLSYAVRERPDDPWMRMHLAAVLAGLGQEKEARKQVDLARKRVPDVIRSRPFQLFESLLSTSGTVDGGA
jgi:tetratricopeptide (TPR) repeat protein